MNNFKIVLITLILIFLNLFSVFSQDTTKPQTKPVTKSDTVYNQNFILADHNYQYINKFSPDTLTRSRFLWYPAKSLEDIFNNVPGYYFRFKDIGQYNPFYFNGFNSYSSGMLRNGLTLKDPADNTIDFNLLSRNEISELELTDGYGNSTYGYNNTINVIQRELFQFRPYTEISFWQDRYENLYFDGNYHQNILKTLNFNFGITKHSYDGHYTNSDLDRWLGRFNLTFAPNSMLNFFVHLNYASIQKGINGGLNSALVNMGDNENVLASDAPVVNSDYYQIKKRFDVDLGSVFKIGKSSFTKIQFYVNNSFVKDRDEENRPNPNGIYYKSNRLGINYGVLLSEVIRLRPSKIFDIISTSEGVYNYNIYHNDYIEQNTSGSFSSISGKLMLRENLDVKYKNFILSGYINAFKNDRENSITLKSGVKADYKYYIDSANVFGVQGMYNNYFNYSSLKLNYRSGKQNISTQLFYHGTNSQNTIKGINNSIFLRLFKFDVEALYSLNISKDFKDVALTEEYVTYLHYGNLSLAWHDLAFKNKLEYKIGLTSRFWSEYNDGGMLNSNRIPPNATFDFYIIGKIGKATFGLTVENILDRVIYNTAYYPFMDRGGFLNTISRFNITWNFFD